MKPLYPVILPVPDAIRREKGPAKASGLSRLARRALENSAARTGLALGRLRKSPSGAPAPENDVFWSVTHKDTFVAGVTARQRIGIDLEQIRPVAGGMFAKIASPEEWLLTGNGKPPAEELQVFFRFWTAKEAVLKATGIGLAGLGGCRITEIRDGKFIALCCAGETWEVEHYCFSGHIAAVVTGGLPVSWQVESPP